MTIDRDTATARALLGDARIIAFLRAALKGDRCIAVTIANRHLDEGRDLDHIFREWKFPDSKPSFRYGCSIKAEQMGPARFLIDFGCQADPTAGDGGQWLVRFDGNGAVAAIEQQAFWIS